MAGFDFDAWSRAQVDEVHRRLLTEGLPAAGLSLELDQALLFTTVLLARADGGEREARLLDALLPVVVPLAGFELLGRAARPEVRARLLAHLVEVEAEKGFDTEAFTMVQEEPDEISRRVVAILAERALAGVERLVGG